MLAVSNQRAAGGGATALSCLSWWRSFTSTRRSCRSLVQIAGVAPANKPRAGTSRRRGLTCMVTSKIDPGAASRVDASKRTNHNVWHWIMCPRRALWRGLRTLGSASLEGCYLDRLPTRRNPVRFPFFRGIPRSIPTQFPCDEIKAQRMNLSDCTTSSAKGGESISVIASPRNQ